MKKNNHLLCIDFESWVVSSVINEKQLDNKTLRKLDEGYTWNSLEFVLQKLKKHKQKVTFFLVFKLEELFPGLIKRIVDEGHEIGWHSYSHPRITTEKILLSELEKSKKLLLRYNVKGFQAPEIVFFRSGYPILKKYGFEYSSSIYGNSNSIYDFDGIKELPVSVSNAQYKPEKDAITFPSSLSLRNLSRFHIPYGSSYFWAIFGKRYYANKFINADNNQQRLNLFIHNWQLIQPDSALYKKEYTKQIGAFSNPLFYPYTINVCDIFDYLLSEFSFQTCYSLVYEKK